MSTYHYCGAVVLGSNMNLGWNEQQTSLTIKVVEDPLDPLGSSFVAPIPGTPSAFSIGAFNYYGIVRSWARDGSTNGLPTYEVNLTDPKDILDVPVILSGYYQPTNFTFNVLNAFGFLENTLGFGGAGVNESGIPWNNVTAALGQMMAVQNLYGSPIVFGNQTYVLNLNDTGLRGSPSYYRIGGGAQSMTIRELISAYCEDAGLDYYCYLTPPDFGVTSWIINVVTVSRRYAPQLGTIANYVSQNTGDILNYSNGLEWANQTTGSVVTGGQVTDLFFGSVIKPFFGKDSAGNVIDSYLESIYCPDWWAAEEYTKSLIDSNFFINGGVPVVNGGKFSAYDSKGLPKQPTFWRYLNGGALYTKANLNAGPIAKYIGQTTYPIDELELRAAREDMGAWKNYVSNIYPYKAAIIGPEGMDGNFLLYKNPRSIADFVRWGEAALAGNIGADTSLQGEAEVAVYNFVKTYAEEYYGKKFLVAIPFMFTATSSETGVVSYSHEPVEAAWHEDVASIGLTSLDSYYFRTADERFQPFAYFTNTILCDKERLQPEDAVFYTSKCYLKANVNQQILSVSGSPYVLVTLNNPLYKLDDFATGSLEDEKRALIEGGQVKDAAQIAAVGGVKQFAKLRAQQPTSAQMGMKLAPAPFIPSVIAVPLKSNILCYGPWSVKTSTFGRVKYEQDESLVPWTYGSSAAMVQAANAKLWNGLSTQEFAERGRISKAGVPLVNLGEAFVSGGPSVTSMQISCSRDGVSTSYEFRTFSPKLNAQDKGSVDRIRRIGLSVQKARRDMVTNIRRQQIARDGVVDAVSARRKRLPSWQQRKTPHDCIIAKVVPQEFDEQGNASADRRVTVSTVEVLEGRMIASLYKEDLESVAFTTTASIMRPFSTYTNAFMPSIVTPTGSNGLRGIDFLQISQTGHDIEIGTQGAGVTGWNQYRSSSNQNYQRSIGYAANNSFVGWGYDLYSQARTVDVSGNQNSGIFRQSNVWHAGPIHMLWDKVQGVWTSHDVALGITDVGISGGSSGSVTLYNGSVPLSISGSSIRVTGKIWMTGASVASGKRVILGYVQHANSWFITGADC